MKQTLKVKNLIELLEKTDSERAGQLTVFKDGVESAVRLQLNKIPTAGMSSLKADVEKVTLAGYDLPIIHKIVISKALLFNCCVTMSFFQIAMSRVSESSSQVDSTIIRCIGSLPGSIRGRRVGCLGHVRTAVDQRWLSGCLRYGEDAGDYGVWSSDHARGQPGA